LRSEVGSLHPLSPRVRALLARGVTEGVFPGAVLAVWHEGRTSLEAVGWRTYLPRPIRNDPSVLYDLASLTKPLATTFCLMRLVHEGRLRLEDELGSLFEAPPWLAGVTLAHLLSHSAGFPAHRPYFARLITHPPEERRALFLKWTLREPPAYPLGWKHVYSDLGFFILGEIVARVSGADLEDYFRQTLDLLGIGDGICFRPLAHGFVREETAATEVCPWRGKLIWGEVHDENTWVLGGVAGQAGLFGRAESVLSLLTKLLLAYLGEEETEFLSRDLLRAFWDWRSPRGTWALGFDRPDEEASSAGELISRRAVGHLGFTGTSFWIDPIHRLIVLLLTNRVHPERTPNRLTAFRPALHDLVFRETVGRPRG